MIQKQDEGNKKARVRMRKEREYKTRKYDNDGEEEIEKGNDGRHRRE
jgi:hypothetical protein